MRRPAALDSRVRSLEGRGNAAPREMVATVFEPTEFGLPAGSVPFPLRTSPPEVRPGARWSSRARARYPASSAQDRAARGSGRALARRSTCARRRGVRLLARRARRPAARVGRAVLSHPVATVPHPASTCSRPPRHARSRAPRCSTTWSRTPRSRSPDVRGAVRRRGRAAGRRRDQDLGPSLRLGRESEQAENFRKMLLSMARDLRVIFIKLADRLHNMRTLEYLPPDKRAADRARDARHLRAARAPARHRAASSASSRTSPQDARSRRRTASCAERVAARGASSARACSKRLEEPLLERARGGRASRPR